MKNLSSPTTENYLKARELLINDEVVVFPTETIYGLGANALSDKAAKRIFQLKGRPSDNPLIVHLGAKEQISDYAFIENEIQQRIIDKLMPGPITLLLQKKENISSIVCPVPLVGIRLPSNQIAHDFLTTVQLPIAAPSANISGKASPTNAQMVYDNLGENVPMIIDGGESEAGIESTVVRVMNRNIQILRPGFVTKEDIETCFDGKIEVNYTHENPELSPGMRYKHYSISGSVVIVNEEGLAMRNWENKENKKIGFLITQEIYNKNQTFFSNVLFKIWGTHSNLAICAHNLFDMYHYFDKEGVDVLYVEELPEVGIGYSIMNRVKRSAEIEK
ncbi:threonylcarbamoyl-AMP synthase [candidate division SR1 bacterium]|nr:threonylcarbamoyl-AMP synthase [candidate division SR1 bacterium]